ncbi:uncharacterized protein JCM6883_005710 [Sporobolomyces salmoneus]|uniref:uncharacterized protein n=1 Tax=Sporobolomyces salmoneus TaxID=183962 RepID=UPI00317F669D
MSDSLSVLILNAEGDQFNASFIADGKRGGIQASTQLYRLAKERLFRQEGINDSPLIVYLVADRKKSFTFPDKRIEAFYDGFGSTDDCSFVVEGIESSPFQRVTQLLDLYLPLESTTSILLGSLHTNQLYPYIISLPPRQKNKITLLSTVSVAPCYRQLVAEGWFKTSTEFENLFGELLTPDVAAKMLWDSVDVVVPEQQQQNKGKERASSIGGDDIWSSSAETSWRAEENPSGSLTKSSGLIWDEDSDVSHFLYHRLRGGWWKLNHVKQEDLPSWDRESQLCLTPPLSPQPLPRSDRSPSSTPPNFEAESRVLEESTVVESPPRTPSPPRDESSSSILAAAHRQASLPPRPLTPVTSSAAVSSTARRQSTPLVSAPTAPRPVVTVTTASHPLPIKPSPAPSVSKPAPVSAIASKEKDKTKETIIHTSQGPVSSLPAFKPPMLSFAAYTEPCKRFYLYDQGCPQTAQSCRFSHAFPFSEQGQLFHP